jgi:hypothetical protein
MIDEPQAGLTTEHDRSVVGYKNIVTCSKHNTTRDFTEEPCWQCHNQWLRDREAKP